MATPSIYSVELNQVPPQAQGFNPLNANQMHGRVRHATFTYVLLGTEVTTTLLGLCIIPKGAMLEKSDIFISATPGSSVTFTIGASGRNLNGFIDDTVGATVADSATLFGSFAPAGAAASGTFADTLAHKVGYIAAKDIILTASVATANVSAVATIFGYVRYVLD